MKITYTVHPIPGNGCKLEVATDDRHIGFSRQRSNSLFVMYLEPAKKKAEVSALRKIFDDALTTVREAVADCEGFDALQHLQQIRSAAERQRDRYKSWAQMRTQDRAELAEIDGYDQEAIDEALPTSTEEHRRGMQRAVLLLAACDWVECWFLETGNVPTAKDVVDPDRVRDAMTERRRQHCEAVFTALQSRTEKTDTVSKLRGLPNGKANLSNAVTKAQKTLGLAGLTWEDGNLDSFEKALRDLLAVDSSLQP